MADDTYDDELFPNADPTITRILEDQPKPQKRPSLNFTNDLAHNMEVLETWLPNIPVQERGKMNSIGHQVINAILAVRRNYSDRDFTAHVAIAFAVFYMAKEMVHEGTAQRGVIELLT